LCTAILPLRIAAYPPANRMALTPLREAFNAA
jgi:hypothetical protein